MEKRISIRLSNEMYRELVSVSKFVEIDRTKLIRYALNEYLKRCRGYLEDENYGTA